MTNPKKSNTSARPFSRRQLTLALYLLMLHVPVFCALAVADHAHNDSDLVMAFFGIFIVTVLIAFPCLVIYFWDAEKSPDLSPRARRFWLSALVLLPQSSLIYWWRYVRTRDAT